MAYQTEQQRKRQREEEERRRRHQSNTGSSIDLMNPLNPISPIYVGKTTAAQAALIHAVAATTLAVRQIAVAVAVAINTRRLRAVLFCSENCIQ